VWAPVREAARLAPYRAYDALTDLLFGTFAQWDADWFLNIATHGYRGEQATAFFPLYPAVVAGVAVVVRSPVVAAVLVSVAAAAVVAILVGRIARPLLGEGAARTALLYVALYPFAYVFTAAYADALFLALAAGSFLAGLRRRPLLAGLLGASAVATRPLGFALLPALVVLLWPRTRREAIGLAPLVLLPAALGAYMVYLDHKFGDALAFSHAQGVYWQRYTPTLGPVGGLWDSLVAGWHGFAELVRHLPRSQEHPHGYARHDRWAVWNLAQFLLLVGALWLTWRAWVRLGAAYGLYSLTLIGIVLTSPARIVPLAGFPRYVLSDFPLFLALAQLTEGRPRARTTVIVAFAAVGAAAAVAFSRKVWVA
jgi:Mannosyltransferase (PIG-V)